MKKKDLLWYTSFTMFILFTLLCITGLANWLIFPKGHGAESYNILVSIRHFFCDIHIWAGLFFLILVVVHGLLHKDYIKINFKKHFSKNQK